MSTFCAKVSKIETMKHLSLVQFDVKGHTLCMMSLGITTPIPIGSDVSLCVNAPGVLIVKGAYDTISSSNQLTCKVTRITMGALLVSICLEFSEIVIESLITKQACDTMDLQEGDSVIAIIKESDIAIVEVHI